MREDLLYRTRMRRGSMEKTQRKPETGHRCRDERFGRVCGRVAALAFDFD